MKSKYWVAMHAQCEYPSRSSNTFEPNNSAGRAGKTAFPAKKIKNQQGKFMQNSLISNHSIGRANLHRNRNIENYRTAASTLGPTSTSLFLLVIVGVLALLYLTQVTKTSVYGYQANNLSAERQELIDRNQELQLEAARLQAVARIQDSKAMSALVPEGSASFINQPN